MKREGSFKLDNMIVNQNWVGVVVSQVDLISLILQ